MIAGGNAGLKARTTRALKVSITRRARFCRDNWLRADG